MSDKKQIEQTIQTYFDCMLESSAEMAKEAFHANAKITGYVGDTLVEIPAADYAGMVAMDQPSPKEKGETLFGEILSIEIAGNTAAVRVRDEWQDKMYLDTLSLIKEGDKWSIYNKLFHIESPSG